MIVVFDLGNVLISVDTQRTINSLNSRHGDLGSRINRLFLENPEWEKNLVLGTWMEDDFIKVLMSKLGNSIPSEEIIQAFADIFKTKDNVISLLPELKNNHPLYLLSNTNEIHENHGFRHYPFLEYFDDLILSHRVGAAKPQERIYRIVEERSGGLPEDHLLIDDLKVNVEGAKARGWKGIQFTGYDDLVRKLKTWGILTDNRAESV